MSDSKSDSISQKCVPDENNNMNNKHVTFAQKKLLFQFMSAHKDFAINDYEDEDVWNELAQTMNKGDGQAVRTIDGWKKTWMKWSKKVKEKKNELSITLLDLQLVSFLEDIDKTKEVTEIFKAFVNGETNHVTFKQLCAIVEILPMLIDDKNFIKLIEQLNELEIEEITVQKNTEAGTMKLWNLFDHKANVENEIQKLASHLDESEHRVSEIVEQKHLTLNELKELLKRFPV